MIDTQIDCPECHGWGRDELGDYCPLCFGTGDNPNYGLEAETFDFLRMILV